MAWSRGACNPATTQPRNPAIAQPRNRATLQPHNHATAQPSFNPACQRLQSRVPEAAAPRARGCAPAAHLLRPRPVASEKQLLRLLGSALHARTIGANYRHDHSSRAHTVGTPIAARTIDQPTSPPCYSHV